METNTIIIEKKNFSDQVTQDYIYEIYEEDYKRQVSQKLYLYSCFFDSDSNSAPRKK